MKNRILPTLCLLALSIVMIPLAACTQANGKAQSGSAAVPAIHLFGESRVTVEYNGEATAAGPGKSFRVESVGGTLAKAAANMDGEYSNETVGKDGESQKMRIKIVVKSGSGFGDLFTFLAGAVAHMVAGGGKP